MWRKTPSVRASLEPIGPIASYKALRLRGPRCTPTNLRKLKLSIEAACVALERGPRFFRRRAKEEKSNCNFFKHFH